MITRRWFIGGAFSAGTLAGCRLLTGGVPSGSPRLTFGVVSDIHVNGLTGSWGTSTFEKALVWFRDHGVDAVVVPGDMANCGLTDELNSVGETWRKVFPDNRAHDGRKVEKLFVTGNHDMGGIRYVRLKFKNAVEKDYAPRIISLNPAQAWRNAFDEEYAPIWSKTVKGYTFVGAHWADLGDRGWDEKFNAGIPAFYDKIGTTALDPKLPFFHIQHPHPKNTCYGAWAWGHDIGLSTQALSKFPNAFALSGHSHYSLTDERSVWQGAFTSVGASSLRYIGLPYDEFAPEGYENSPVAASKHRKFNLEKLLPNIDCGDSRQGMLWKVYDDCIVIQRRDFMRDASLGPDWVLPISTACERPFAFAEHAKKFSPPRFVEGAKLAAVEAMAKNRAKVEKRVLEVTVPPCVADSKARVFRFEVSAKAGGKTVTKRILAHGFDKEGASPARNSLCRFDFADFADANTVQFKATPFNCFGHAGEPLTLHFTK